MGTLVDPWPNGFSISEEQVAVMLREVQQHAQEEACGLVVRVGADTLRVYPITNALHSLVRFYMQPEELLSVFSEVDEKGWELTAIYHSHLKGPAVPSFTDIAEFRYPGIVSLIWSPVGESWTCRAFLISGQEFHEIPIEVF